VGFSKIRSNCVPLVKNPYPWRDLVDASRIRVAEALAEEGLAARVIDLPAERAKRSGRALRKAVGE
jgi:hypothetical protein